jgi:hypothetical protein
MTKIIFLDIDGVMNSSLFYHQRYNKLTSKLNRFKHKLLNPIKRLFLGKDWNVVFVKNIMNKTYTFEYLFNRLVEETDPTKWKLLRGLCNELDIKICISSVWKHHFNSPDDWDKALTLLGFKPDTFIGITKGRETLRGTEIQKFINNLDCLQLMYVILYDDSDMLPEQKDNFLHIDGYYGISPNTTYKIGRYFSGESDKVSTY